MSPQDPGRNKSQTLVCPKGGLWMPGGVCGSTLRKYVKTNQPRTLKLPIVFNSGRPRGRGRSFQKVGGFAPHLLKGSPEPPGAGQTPLIDHVRFRCQFFSLLYEITVAVGHHEH